MGLAHGNKQEKFTIDQQHQDRLKVIKEATQGTTTKLVNKWIDQEYELIKSGFNINQFR